MTAQIINLAETRWQMSVEASIAHYEMQIGLEAGRYMNREERMRSQAKVRAMIAQIDELKAGR